MVWDAEVSELESEADEVGETSSISMRMRRDDSDVLTSLGHGLCHLQRPLGRCMGELLGRRARTVHSIRH